MEIEKWNLKLKWKCKGPRVAKTTLKKNSKVGVLKVYYDNKVQEYDLIVKDDILKSNYIETFINILKDVICGVQFK